MGLSKFQGGRQEYSDWFENDSPYDQILSRLYNTSESFWPTTENLEAVAKGKRVILTNRVFVLSKSIQNVFPLPFNVFANQIEMISERGFPLLNRFSNIIAFMRDAGIIQKLYNDFYFNATVLQSIIRNREGGLFQEGRIVLTLSHMDGAFTLLLFGCSISFTVFCAEIIIDTYNKRRMAQRFEKLQQNAQNHMANAMKCSLCILTELLDKAKKGLANFKPKKVLCRVKK